MQMNLEKLFGLFRQLRICPNPKQADRHRQADPQGLTNTVVYVST
jgi:hypothetical protein